MALISNIRNELICAEMTKTEKIYRATEGRSVPEGAESLQTPPLLSFLLFDNLAYFFALRRF